jgi:lipoprotein-anchoring transpeptidase ErfK/SrfK
MGKESAAIETKPVITDVLHEAQSLEQSGKSEQAKALYRQLVLEHADSPDVMQWQKRVESINMELLFSPAVTEKSVLYEIKPGDTLSRIAKEHGTTVELIMKANGLSTTMIMPGRQLKVWNAPFTILVDKSQNSLILRSGDDVIKTYVVSTGKDNSTPVGTFTIVNKLTDPTWFRAGAVVPPSSPENILGTRWLGFDLAGYGIHGTTEPEKLGQQVTLGCVRMANPEVEELYTIVPVGTEVIVTD